MYPRYLAYISTRSAYGFIDGHRFYRRDLAGKRDRCHVNPVATHDVQQGGQAGQQVAPRYAVEDFIFIYVLIKSQHTVSP